MFSHPYVYYYYIWFLPELIFHFFLSNHFDYWFPYCIHLDTWSTQEVNVAQHMCWFFKASNSPMFFSINYFNFIIYDLTYLTFRFHLILLLSDVLLTLFLVGDMSCLCILYHNCKEWSTRSSWSCWILLVAWHRRDTSGEFSHLWILSWCHMDYKSFGSFWLGFWHWADILWWVFGFHLLFSYPGFLESMLCTLSSCYDGGYVLN